MHAHEISPEIESDPNVLSTAEAAEHLGLPIATLYKHIQAGKLTPVEHKGLLHLERAEVESLYEELAQDKGTFAGALEAIDHKVLDELKGIEGIELETEIEHSPTQLVTHLFRLATAKGWNAITIAPRGTQLSLTVKDPQPRQFAVMEGVLATEIVSELCKLAELSMEKPASRSEFTFEADDRKTLFRAARASSSTGEHLHFVRLEEDHPEFNAIWSLDSIQSGQIDAALDKGEGLYLLVSPRDIAGEAHMLSFAKRLCPDESTGILLTQSKDDASGFLTPILYGEDEGSATLGDSIKTIFALEADLVVLPEIKSPTELYAALELTAAGIAVVAYAGGASLPEAIAQWHGWEVSPIAIARAFTLGIERTIQKGKPCYRLLNPDGKLSEAMSQDAISAALEPLMS